MFLEGAGAIATEVAPTSFPHALAHRACPELNPWASSYNDKTFSNEGAFLRPEPADAGHALPAVPPGLRDMRGIHTAQRINGQRGGFGQ